MTGKDSLLEEATPSKLGEGLLPLTRGDQHRIQQNEKQSRSAVRETSNPVCPALHPDESRPRPVLSSQPNGKRLENVATPDCLSRGEPFCVPPRAFGILTAVGKGGLYSVPRQSSAPGNLTD